MSKTILAMISLKIIYVGPQKDIIYSHLKANHSSLDIEYQWGGGGTTMIFDFLELHSFQLA
jgi:hypothetical protein